MADWLRELMADGDLSDDYGVQETTTPTMNEYGVVPEEREDTSQPYVAPDLIGQPNDPTPYATTTGPKEWELAPYKRISKSAQENFGAIWGGVALMSDTLGAEGARDWAIGRSNELFEKAADTDIISTQFKEISNPIDLAKFTAEKVVEYIPTLALMATGSGGAAVGASKLGATTLGRAGAKSLARKTLKNNISKLAKSGSSLTAKQIRDKAYKSTLTELGALAGMASVEGGQGAGGMYLRDVELRGVDEASPLAAAVGGVGQAAVSMVSPFNRALSKIAVGKGVTDVASMTFGEAFEEVVQGGIEKLHEAGIDPYLTVDEIFSDPATYWELAEAGFVGAVVGGAYGGGARIVFGKEEDPNSKVVDPNDSELVEESPTPSLTPWEQRVKDAEAAVEDYWTNIQAPAAAQPTATDQLETTLPELPTTPTNQLMDELVAETEDTTPAASPEAEALRAETTFDADAFEKEAKRDTYNSWFNRFAPKVEQNKKLSTAMKQEMDQIEQDSNNVKEQEAKLPTNVKQRNTARKILVTKKKEIAVRVNKIVEEVETPPTKEELEAQRVIDIAEAQANVSPSTTAGTVASGERVMGEGVDSAVEIASEVTAPAAAVDVVTKTEEIAAPKTTDPHIQLILKNDVEGLKEDLETNYQNPSAAFGDVAFKVSEYIEENNLDGTPLDKQLLTVLKDVAASGLSKRTGTAKTGNYVWTSNKKSGLPTTDVNPKTGKSYTITKDGKDFVLMGSDFIQVTTDKFKTEVAARKALETLVPLDVKVATTRKKVAKKEGKKGKKTVAAIPNRVSKVKKAKILAETKAKDAAKKGVESPPKPTLAEAKATALEESKKASTVKKDKKKEKVDKKETPKPFSTKTKITSQDGRAYILEDLATAVFKAGQSLGQFASKMREKLGNAYLKIAGKIKSMYNKLNAHLDKVTSGAQAGSIGDTTADIWDVKKEVEAVVEPTKKKVEEVSGDKSTKTLAKDRAFSKKKGIKIDGIRAKYDTFLKNSIKGFEKYFSTTSERMRGISTKLLSKVRWFEYKLHRKNLAHLKEVNSFIKGLKKLSPEDEFALTKALFNGNTKIRDEILSENNLGQDFDKVQGVLKDIETRMVEVGLLSDKVKNYFPRSVRDIDGLIAHYKDKPEDYSFVKFEIDKAAALRPEGLSTAEEDQIITDILMSGNYRNIPRPGSTKDRNVDYVQRELVEYYHNIGDTLLNHIAKGNEAVEARVLLGKSSRPKKMRTISALTKEIEVLADKGELNTKDQQTLDSKLNEHHILYSELIDLEAELDESIASFIKKNVKGKKQDEAVELVRARLKQKGATGNIATMRNVAYMFALSSPTSAITQIGDLTWSIYRNGPINSMKGAGRAMRGMIDKKYLARDEFDFTHSQQEMGGVSTNKMLDKVLTITGLKGMDIFAKETAMQSTLEKWKTGKNARADFIKSHAEMFGGKVEAGKVWNDINTGKQTEDVLFALFNDLSNWQPISLSEVPQGYLTAGNGRIFYMLKTFAIKAINSIHREVATDYKAGNYKSAANKLVALTMALAISGAAADELKDILLGTESKPLDNVIDNLLQLVMLNKYSAMRGLQSDSFITYMINSNLPPARFADDFVADLWSGVSKDKDFKFKSAKQIPLVGKVAWSRFSEFGREAELSNRKEDIYDDLRSTVSGNRDIKDIREPIREYNKDVRKYNKGKKGDERLKPILATNIKNVRRRERKKENK